MLTRFCTSRYCSLLCQARPTVMCRERERERERESNQALLITLSVLWKHKHHSSLNSAAACVQLLSQAYSEQRISANQLIVYGCLSCCRAGFKSLSLSLQGLLRWITNQHTV